jgi:hypothetical protein
MKLCIFLGRVALFVKLPPQPINKRLVKCEKANTLDLSEDKALNLIIKTAIGFKILEIAQHKLNIIFAKFLYFNIFLKNIPI